MNYWSVIVSYAASVHIVFSPLPTRFGHGHLIFTLQVLDANMIITGAFIYYSFRPSLKFQPLQITHLFPGNLDVRGKLTAKGSSVGNGGAATPAQVSIFFFVHTKKIECRFVLKPHEQTIIVLCKPLREQTIIHCPIPIIHRF